jgi:hypothetical protein
MVHFTVHADNVTDFIFNFNMVQPSEAVTALLETSRKIIFFEQTEKYSFFCPTYCTIIWKGSKMILSLEKEYC